MCLAEYVSKENGSYIKAEYGDNIGRSSYLVEGLFPMYELHVQKSFIQLYLYQNNSVLTANHYYYLIICLILRK
jgi:hypothetical protein